VSLQEPLYKVLHFVTRSNKSSSYCNYKDNSWLCSGFY